MKVSDQANAIVDTLAEKYNMDDLPGALGDVIYLMLTRAAIKGAYGFDLAQALSEVADRLEDDGLSV